MTQRIRRTHAQGARRQRALSLLLALLVCVGGVLVAGQARSAQALYEQSGFELEFYPFPDDTLRVHFAWGDYDRDGDLDLATANRTHEGQPAALRVYDNNRGALSAAARWSSSERDGYGPLDWVDVDGDGDLDLVAAYASGSARGKLRLYANTQGALATSATWERALATQISAMAWGDVDGDADPDVGIATGGSAALYLLHEGQLAGDVAWRSQGDDRSQSLAWGDVDGDDDLDLVVGSNWSGMGALRLYQNDEGSMRDSASWVETDVQAPFAVEEWGDYDNDGDLDLLVGRPGTSLPSVIYRNDNGTLTPLSPALHHNGWQTYDGAWADYDGDGDLDVASVHDTYIAIYDNQNGEFQDTSYATHLEIAQLAAQLEVVDYDNDGDLDLTGLDFVFKNNRSMLSPIRSWIPRERFGGTSYLTLDWGDLDGDGDLDLAVGGFPSWNEDVIGFYRNEGGVLAPELIPINVGENYGTLKSIALGDVDGDGDLDLAAARGEQPNILFRNNGGTFEPTQTWTDDGSLNSTYDVAWGDSDGDGDLDLAVMSALRGPMLYQNDQGVLAEDWVALEGDTPYDMSWGHIVWGDLDGDGDLDLIAGNDRQPLRLYRNDGARLSDKAVWASTQIGATRTALGDVDADGDLDLAVASAPGRLEIYHNQGGQLPATPTWASLERSDFTDVAWGDADNDGDLDLAAGNNTQPVRLFRNDGGTLSSRASWFASATDALLYNNIDVAWGDVDGDGDLDLAAAGGTYEQPQLHYNQTYTRDRHTPSGAPHIRIYSPAPASAGVYGTPQVLEAPTIPITYTLFDPSGTPADAVHAFYSIDGGGRWLPAIAATGTVTRSLATRHAVDYRSAPLTLDIPDGGAATATLVVSGAQTLAAQPIADLDLWIAAQHPRPDELRLALQAPDGTTVPLVTLGPNTRVTNLTLDDESSEASLWHVRPDTPLAAFDGLEADGTWTLHVEDSTAGNTGTLLGWGITLEGGSAPHVFHWDTFASGFFGQSDNVVFRIEALPRIVHTPNQAARASAYGATSAVSAPFRARGTQIRVTRDDEPVAGALVYRLEGGKTVGGALLGADPKTPFTTNAQGFLQGGSQLALGDRLLALAPIGVGERSRLYATNGTPTVLGVEAWSISAPGVQTLEVTAEHPLRLFDLHLSLEWDASQDPLYLQQLSFNLKRAAAYLYDFTDGQVALGRLTVHQNADDWATSDILVHATNRLRPFAAQGGILSQPMTDPQHQDITYDIGQVHMGSTWNRYGRPGQTIGEDWPIVLAHELSHYLLFQEDTYLGVDAQGLLLPVETCVGSAMGDLYTNPSNTELVFARPVWEANCAETLANQTLGRTEWETVRLWYPELVAPEQVLSGPALQPFDFTQIELLAPITPTMSLEDPTFELVYADGSASSAEARAFAVRDDAYIFDLGSPIIGQTSLLARGVAVGDRLCVFDRPRSQQGCMIVSQGVDRLFLQQDEAWSPIIQLTPIASDTLRLQVAGVPAGLNLHGRIYPEYGAGSATVQLGEAAGSYSGTLELDEPTLAGHVQIWVAEAAPRREAIVSYAVGGNPGRMRGSHTARRGGGGRMRGSHVPTRSGSGAMRAGSAPLISSDGQFIFFTRSPEAFEDGEFFTIQAAAGLPALPAGRTPIGQGYTLVATAGTPIGEGSVTVQYFDNDLQVAGLDEDSLQLYHWDEQRWTLLPTAHNGNHNMVSAPSAGAGTYVLMASVQRQLAGPGWSMLFYPIKRGGVLPQALASIAGSYTTVYEQQPADSADPWKMYDVDAPAWVNELETLQYQHVYWVYTSNPITLYLGLAEGDTPAVAQIPAATPQLPPATFYGEVLPSPTLAPSAGLPVSAWVQGRLCGQGQTRDVGGQIVYVVDVASAGPENMGACGAPGALVSFSVGGRLIQPRVGWRHGGARRVDLNDATRIWLPQVES